MLLEKAMSEEIEILFKIVNRVFKLFKIQRISEYISLPTAFYLAKISMITAQFSWQ